MTTNAKKIMGAAALAVALPVAAYSVGKSTARPGAHAISIMLEPVPTIVLTVSTAQGPKNKRVTCDETAPKQAASSCAAVNAAAAILSTDVQAIADALGASPIPDPSRVKPAK